MLPPGEESEAGDASHTEQDDDQESEASQASPGATVLPPDPDSVDDTGPNDNDQGQRP